VRIGPGGITLDRDRDRDHDRRRDGDGPGERRDTDDAQLRLTSAIERTAPGRARPAGVCA
jgi:hypothetical protein